MGPRTQWTTQELLNLQLDDSVSPPRLVLGIANWNGSSYQTVSNTYATKVTVSGSITYVGKAAPGSAQSSAVWQCMKIDESSGTIVTWADSNANFDNVATDLTALSYG